MCKGNSRRLKKLYQTTQAGIEANIALLVGQAHDRIVETEQLSVAGLSRMSAGSETGKSDVGFFRSSVYRPGITIVCLDWVLRISKANRMTALFVRELINQKE